MSGARRSGATTTIHLTVTVPTETVMATVAAIRQLEVEANRPPEAAPERLPHLTREEALHRRQRQRQATRTKATAMTLANTTTTTQGEV